MAKNTGKIIPLFAIDSKGRLEFFVADGKMKPEAGWTIISLLQPDNKQEMLKKDNEA